jgi:signal transduction histidine kinase
MAAEPRDAARRNRSVTAVPDDAPVVQGVANGVRRPLFFAPPPSSQPGASVGEAIHEAFVVDGSRAQVWVVGRLGSLVGTILGIGIAISLLADGPPDTGSTLAIVAAISGVVAGQVLLRKAQIPIWALDTALAFAYVVLAQGGIHSEPLRTLLPAVYTALGTGVFLIRKLQASLLHTALAGASYGYVLWQGPDTRAPFTRWVAVVAMVLIAGTFVRWLVSRVTSLATTEHAARLEAVRATGELERVSEAKSAFLARMSHELRTPLNVVVGFADVLRDGLVGPLTPRQQGYVEDIAGSGRDLLRLVDQLLDVSKVEAGELDLVLNRIDIADAVSDAELLVRARAREAGVALRVDRPATPVVAEADPLRIRQIAWNLLGNAVKFTPRGGSVDVRVTVGAERVRVAVRDTGPGIAPDEQQRIFEQYQQGSSAEGGSGIGLALSRRLIEAHGGTLTVESTPGHGSTFAFELPRHQVAADAPAPDERLPAPPAWSDLEQALLVPGSVANLRTMAAVGQRFAKSAAWLLPVLAIITPGAVAPRLAVCGVAGLAALASLILSRGANDLPNRAIDLIGFFGTILVSTFVLLSNPFDDVVALAYGWPILASSALLTGRRVSTQVANVVLMYGIVLAIDQTGRPLDHWIAVAMTVTVDAVVIGWVSGRLREAMSEALSARLAAEAARAQVEAVSAHKSDFLANTSHELCTPLNAIIGFTQVLRDEVTGPLEPRQAEYLEDILASGQQLLALITDLLDLAKLEAGRLPRTPRAMSLTSLVQNVVTELSPMASRRSIALVVEAPESLPLVEADSTNLYHALANLIANGIKFTSDGGRVEVLARQAGDRVLLSVRDNGIGILPEQRPHLFEAFHQGTRPVPLHARGGTGLGLTLAKGLVELEGGRIAVESTPDVGSTFTIELPAPAVPARTAVHAAEAAW